MWTRTTSFPRQAHSTQPDPVAFVSVTMVSPGLYCMAAGIWPDLHPAVVSQTDEMLASVAWDEEMAPSGVCAVGQYGIMAFSINGATGPLGFTIIIPWKRQQSSVPSRSALSRITHHSRLDDWRLMTLESVLNTENSPSHPPMAVVVATLTRNFHAPDAKLIKPE